MPGLHQETLSFKTTPVPRKKPKQKPYKENPNQTEPTFKDLNRRVMLGSHHLGETRGRRAKQVSTVGDMSQGLGRDVPESEAGKQQ